jgi:5'-nucleotidase (lipoprotein e(P4) family)
MFLRLYIMKIKYSFFTFALVLASSLGTYFLTSSNSVNSQIIVADNEYQVAATLFMQHAGEYRALSFQAFNIAKLFLDKDFEKKSIKMLPKSERKRTRAVVVDIDETVLDNSPAQAYTIKNRLPFNLKDWYAWGELRKAKAIPGSVDFLNYANSKGVKIFYVSNRDEVQKQATIDNLKAVGFPDVNVETVLLRQSESSKTARRTAISQNYRIVILAGDNLNDLSEVFEKKSVADRFVEVDKTRELYGNKFIVLPNAMYGAWEDSIYDNKRLSETEKTAKRNSMLMNY